MKLFAPMFILIAAFAFLSAGCSSNTKDGGSDNTSRGDFQSKARQQLDKLDKEIDQARSRIDTNTSDEQEALKRRLDDLEDERAELGDKIDDLANANDDDWNRIKDDIESEFDDLEGKLKSAVDDLWRR
jgi:septal ring factor EnvC (AmiA/AmiB activator)